MSTAPTDAMTRERDPGLPLPRSPQVLGVRTLIVVALLLAGVSIAVLPRGIAYDPWSWLIWGREALHLSLDTRDAATSIKPLPLAVITVLSVFGSAAPLLWLFLARASAILAVGLAWRIGHRLAGPLAGGIAVVGVVTIYQFASYLFFTGMSEPTSVATALAAWDAWLLRRPRTVTVMLLATALLRIEAWPFLAGWLAWRWWQSRLQPWRLGRAAAAGGILVILPLAWFGTDYLGSGMFLRSAAAASQESQGGPLLSAYPGLATVTESIHLLAAPLTAGFVVTAVAAVVLAVRRRDRLALDLTGATAAALGWLAVVAVMAQLRIATGAIRYLLPAAAVAVVIASVGIALAARALATALAGRVAQPVVVGVAMLVVAAVAIPQFTEVSARASGEWSSDAALDRLSTGLPVAVARAGGLAQLSCGQLSTSAPLVPVLAWTLHRHLEQVGHKPGPQGTVFSEEGLPVIPAQDRSAYRVVATEGSGLSRWTVLTTC